MKILIADDNPEFAEMLKLALKPIGQCEIFCNGTEAFKGYCNALKEGAPFDLLFIDIMMPMRDGFGAVSSIQVMFEKLNISVPIVMMTGYSIERFAARAKMFDIEHLISKNAGIKAFLQIARKYADLRHTARSQPVF